MMRDKFQIFIEFRKVTDFGVLKRARKTRNRDQSKMCNTFRFLIVPSKILLKRDNVIHII